MHDDASTSAGEWESAFHSRSQARQTYPNPWSLRNSRFACGPDAADVLDMLLPGDVTSFTTGYGPDAVVLLLMAIDEDTKVAFELDPSEAAGFAGSVCNAVSSCTRTHGGRIAA